ncbi:uncharacterized protein BDW43DRAFT_290008 [Aspergillus alliaceus]|uniref:uncharacterized protein n=1 Tax=Petromyces alliaceus TaxID=209559 RepID=UPI0012A6FD8E|nr:uncharacterized protein BDW43DRAFT_290008 [Aspergillus alliaceus]KAB8228804.1 hypothetical protein BDW43DRAFT_290008 [Aspergillus alliaceus]
MHTIVPLGDNGGQPSPLKQEYYSAIRPHLRYPSFVSCPEKSNIYLFDSISSSGPKIDGPRVFSNSEDFETHIATTSRPNARIVSICSQNSMRPLGITEQAMRKLINTYAIDPTFLDLAISFGDKPQSSDAGHGAMTVRQGEDGSYDMQYLFAYAEDNSAQVNVPWTIRQICVFHRYNPTGSGNLWIFLHARPRSVMQQLIEAEITSQHAGIPKHWFSMHLLVLSTYIGNWRWCIRSLGEEIEKTVDIALTLDLARADNNKDGLIRLLTPQYLGDKLLPLSSRVHAALITVRKLEELNTVFHAKNYTNDGDSQRFASEMAYYRTTLEGYLKSVEVLEGKVKGISDLLAVALNLKGQTVANEINNKMLKLTSETFDDNATVRVVTLVTLIYLPASFVSTLLGMNLFDFEGPNGEVFRISRQFWIFVVAAVPLTLLTLGSWYYVTQRRLRFQKKKLNEKKELHMV